MREIIGSIEYPDVPVWLRISDQPRDDSGVCMIKSVVLIKGDRREYFNSMREAEKFLGVGCGAVSNAFIRKGRCHGWLITGG